MKAYRKTRNQEIRQLFEKLYHQRRIRFDDALEKLSLKYGLAERTIWRIIRREGAYQE